VTVGGESDKVKPNGKNRPKSTSNRHCTSQTKSTLRQKATTPAVIGFPVRRAGKAGFTGTLATL
jgi:hypothetical protein